MTSAALTHLKLVPTHVGWRIADIGPIETSSLLGALEKSTRENQAGH